MKTNRVNNWCNAFVQPTTFLGVLAIVIILSGAFFLKAEEYNRAYEDGIRRGADLTRVLEENVSHIFYGTDSQLLLFRQLYQREPKDFDSFALDKQLWAGMLQLYNSQSLDLTEKYCRQAFRRFPQVPMSVIMIIS